MAFVLKPVRMETKTVKEELRNYSVYIHRNPVNRKTYVGQTALAPERRWNDGKGYSYNKDFYDDILKYGWSNFTHEVIASGLSFDEANSLEREKVSELKSNDPAYGYNRTPGGGGVRQYTTKEVKCPVYPLMKREEVADFLGISVEEVKAMEDAGLPCLHITKRTARFSYESVMKFIEVLDSRRWANLREWMEGEI